MGIMLGQFMDYYKIDSEKVLDIAKKKVDRTIERIETGYYNKL